MRYEKGSIHLSEARDVPLLRQVFHSAYATRDQLYEFMRLQGRERALAAFRMRLARLVKHGLIDRVASPHVSQSLYAISRPGVDVLVDRGVPYAGRGCGLDRPVTTASHALQLNAMHLALLRSGQLQEWIPETEIYSRNTLTSWSFAKDYDAVVAIAGQRQPAITFALEYERSQKTEAEYQNIVIALNRETQVDFVLYATATSHLSAKLSAALRHCRQSIAICAATDLIAQMFEVSVLLIGEQWRMTLRELVELKRGVKSASAAPPSAVTASRR